MKILAIGRPRAGIDVRASIAPHAHREVTELWRLYTSGAVREMYSPGGPGAVLILEADSLGAAADALSSLPLVAERIIEFELIELHPFAASGTLFAADDAR
jgi:hypothetical protein